MSGRDILLKARSHFRAARTVETLAKIEVPEWETTIHYWPDMSVEESREVGRHIRIAGGQAAISAGDLTEASVTQILLRARDAFGNRLFTDGDATALADTDPAVLRRIASAMGWSGRESVEDAAGN